MKFLCDRCKTRYSIADERVHGKILKIRCKNCANVITVREGMEQPVELLTPVPVAQQRSGQRATPAPGAKVSGKPLEAAFATAMSSPGIKVPPAAPAALDEEWYVSIDGNQQGPFSLGQAQGWIRARGSDDELYCWSEGFDDWLPVEKVSHFRGLRGRIRPATLPPPLPIDQSEPKPLFAATLAALEQDAPTSIGSPPIKLEDLMPRAQPRQPASSPVPAPAPAKPSGRTSSLPAPGVGPRGRDGAPPLPGTGPVKSPFDSPGPALPLAAAPSGPMSAVSSTSNPSLGAAPAIAPASGPVSSMFGKGSATTPSPSNGSNGANGHADPGASATQPMFDNAGYDDGDAAPDALSAGAARGAAMDDDEENDDLSIGEVSRVVRLQDIARPSMTSSTRSTGSAASIPRRTPQAGAVARGTGAVPKFEQAALAASGDGLPPMPLAVPPALTGTESEIVQQLAQPPRAMGHRVLLIGGLGLVAILATLVIVFSARGDDDEDPTQGPKILSGEEGLEDISMEVAVTVLPQPTNPENPTTNPPTNGSGGKPTNTGGTRPKNPNNGGSSGNNGGNNGKVEPDRAGLTALSGDDVVTMSQKMSTGPRRCYEQAKKKDPFLDVKRLRAVITVDKSGTVTRVELIDHANAQLDTCLSGAIGRWKFRENSEGLTSQVSFAFMSG